MQTLQVTPDEDFEDPEELEPEEDEDDGYCVACAGTGEGQYDGAACFYCRGRGFLRVKPDLDDFTEPDPEDNCDGPL